MFGLFYPETGERYMPFREFETLQDVETYMADKPAMLPVKAQSDDLQAWLNERTGDLLVVRRLTPLAVDDANALAQIENIKKEIASAGRVPRKFWHRH